MTRSASGSTTFLAVVALAAIATLLALTLAPPAHAVAPAPVTLPGALGSESEPNGTTATADPISSGERVRATIQPNGDIDTFQFSATAGDRVFANVMTSGSSSASTDSQLRIFDATDTLVEFDEDDGSQGTLSSTIAGATLPAAGTYTLQVKHFSATNTLRPYHLYFQLRSGAPVAETEPNDTSAQATPLPGGFASGTRDPAAAGEQDFYSMTLNAGDTVFLSLDLDPERDNVQWNGRLSFGLVGDAGNQLLTVNDNSPGSLANPLAESFVMTVKQAGTYFAMVDSADAAAGGPTATYRLSTSVMPAATPSCRSYPASGAPAAIADAGTTSFDFAVPAADAAIIDRAAVRLDLTHQQMADLDASLQSPAGNDNGLFTDIGQGAPGGQEQMDLILDDDAALPLSTFTIQKPLISQPELVYRLDWFEGEKAQGNWKLVLRDDLATNTGTLNGAELILCARPEPKPASTVFEAGFESGDDGFTHSGAADEWERGTPATAATTTANPTAGLSTCASGSGCWKTDLDGTYEVSSNQDLLSPPISLVGQSGKLTARWQQWFQMESATFDHYTVSVEEDGGANPRDLYRWDGATMTHTVGTPTVNIGASAGWGEQRADISDYAGKTIRLRFHLDSDTSIGFAGVGIDDVAVTQRDAAFPVAVTAAGSGSGFVDSAPAGIDCSLNTPAKTACVSNFPDGTAVTLTAHPDAGTTFSGFSGAGCSGGGATCVVTADQARSVTATFAAQPRLTVSTSGAGRVTGPGIDCPGDCTEIYADGTSVTLTATPDAGASFSGWGGDCAASAGTSCVLNMGANRSASASFAAVAPDCQPEAAALAAAQEAAGTATKAKKRAQKKSKKATKKVKKAKKKVKKASGGKQKKAAKKKLKKAKKKSKKAARKLKRSKTKLRAARKSVTAARADLDACLGG